MKEKSGLELKQMRADIAIDSTKMKVTGDLATPESKLALNLTMRPNPVSNLDLDNGLIDADIDASIGSKDLRLFVPFSNMPAYPLNVKGEMHGNMKEVDISQLTVNWQTALSANARGKIYNLNAKNLSARMHTDVKTYNLNFVKSMLDRSTARMINIPAMRATGDIVYNGNGNVNVNMKAYEGKGVINANVNGNVNSASLAGWNIDANAKGVNVNHFVKGYNLSDVDADVALRNGRLTADVNSHAGDVRGNFTVNGTMVGRVTDLAITTDLKHIDLYRLKVTEAPLTIGLCSNIDVKTDMNQYYEVKGVVSGISVTDTATTYFPDDIALDILTATSP